MIEETFANTWFLYILQMTKIWQMTKMQQNFKME